MYHRKMSLVSDSVNTPDWAAPLAKSSRAIVGIRIRYMALPRTLRLLSVDDVISCLWHSASAQLSAASNTTISLVLSVSRCRMLSRVWASMSQKPSERSASSAWASITSQQRCVSSGSSNRQLWESKTQAFLALRLVSRKVTQARAR